MGIEAFDDDENTSLIDPETGLDRRIDCLLEYATEVMLRESTTLALQNDEPRSKELVRKYRAFYLSCKSPLPQLCDAAADQVVSFLNADTQFLYGKERAYCLLGGLASGAGVLALVADKPDWWPAAVLSGAAFAFCAGEYWWLRRRAPKAAQEIIGILERSRRYDGFARVMTPYLGRSLEYMGQELQAMGFITNNQIRKF